MTDQIANIALGFVYLIALLMFLLAGMSLIERRQPKCRCGKPVNHR